MRVQRTLLEKGYRFTNEQHVEAIMAYWGSLEEFAPDPTEQAIVHMYEVLDMYDYILKGGPEHYGQPSQD